MEQLLFQPIQIGPLRLRNRIEVSPAEPFLCTRDGLVTDEFVAYTEQFAKAGAGIVTVGDSPVTQAYADENHYVVNLADPFVVHGLVKVTEAIHRWGAVASIELNLRDERLPHEFSREEMAEIIRAFADAAERCRKASFDMVMIHLGHGHTAASFFSPHMNKRSDEYGCQTMENRTRFARELLTAVRQRIGPNMALEIRFSGDEIYPEGVHVEEGIAIIREIQDLIDLLHISAGSMYDVRTVSYTIQPTYMPRPTNLHIARKYKEAGLRIPVVSVGSFDMASAMAAVEAGECDMVAMIRAFLADPEHIHKAKAGKLDEIRPCIRCNVCTGDDPHGCPKPLRCTVNARQGKQPHFEVLPAGDPQKKVIVVGGGCAGMEAARRLAERGMKPILIEKEAQLGGSLRMAGANPLKSDVRRYAQWSEAMTLRTEGIDVRLGVEATRELIRQEQPDALIIAVGSSPIIPPVPGVDGQNVCLATDLDSGRVKPGKRVVIVGAGLTGTETAVTRAREGHEVVVMDMLSMEAVRMRDKAVAQAQRLAMEAGVSFKEGLKLEAVTESGVLAREAGGALTEIACDTVALSLGVRPRSKVLEELSGICPETWVAGDCNTRQGNITSAVREGFYAAMNV